MTQKVFVSHASEDKERFVLTFAERLRENGVDAWLDKWEMLPGDSLVDKIFEEGIKDAAAVIVILSNSSVNKPWVHEELNAAVVKRINSGSKLIPVVLDDCKVPDVLANTLWERIADLKSYDASFDRILASIFDVSTKPPLGKAPHYTQSPITLISGMHKNDSLLLKLSCENAIETGNTFIDPKKLFFVNGKPIMPEQEIKDSMEIMDKFGSIELHRTLGDDIHSFQITESGFELYARDCIPNYEEKITAVMFALVNEQLSETSAIATKIDSPQLLVDHILDILEHRGDIQQSKMISGARHVHYVSPSLRRALSN